MGLSSLFKRSTAIAPAPGDAAQVVEVARTRARRRLLGAVLLLGVGIIAFPLLFETQPRPIPVDIAIEIPRKEGAAPLAAPAPRPGTAVAPAAPVASKPAPAAPVITESKADAGKEVAASVDAAIKREPAPKAVPPSAPAIVAAAAEAKSPVEAAGRFVVQVGAFADNNLAREARAKVEALGLKTYVQSVDTDNGKRIRVRLGPFSSRDDAEKAAAKVKAAGLAAAVLTL